jgi:hypothetical protein
MHFALRVCAFHIFIRAVMLGIVSNRIREFNGETDCLQRMGITILVGDFCQVCHSSSLTTLSFVTDH